MQTMSSKEFFEQLNSNSLKTPIFVKGIAKKGEKLTEILFRKKEDSSEWITIPSSLVEEVKIIKTFKKEEQTRAVVKLQLKTPATPEGKILMELLASSNGDMEKKSKCQGGNGHEGSGYGSHGECQHHGCKNCSCGCHKVESRGDCKNEDHYCSCGCHHEANCSCACDGMSEPGRGSKEQACRH